MSRTWLCTCLAMAIALLSPRVFGTETEPRDAAAQLPEIEYRFESITVRGNSKTRAFFFRNMLGLEPGEQVRVGELDRFRRRLLSTGFFAEVDARLAEGSRPETVIVEVDVVEHNTIIIQDVFFGISASDSPLWGGLDLAETNLLGSGLLLAGAFVLSADQGALRLNLADPYRAVGLPFAWYLEGLVASAAGRGPTLNQVGLPSTLAFEYDRGGGRIGVGIIPWTHLGIELEYRLESIDFRYLGRSEPLPRTGMPVGQSLLSTLGLRIELDNRDRAQLPTAGGYVGLLLDGGGSFLASDYEYLRLTGEANLATPLDARQVLRFQLIGGALWARDGRAPYFEGFYIGDMSDLVADRDLELQFTDRRSPDFFNNGADLVTYGDLFGRLSGEYAHDIRPVYGPLSRVEAFVSVGLLGVRQGPWDIGRPRVAVNNDPDVTVSGFHLDLTFNFGLRADTPVGLFEISIGQALSLAPLN